MGPLSSETLRKLQSAPKDEFGVTHHNILYNQGEDKVWCVLNAPSKDAGRKHHEHAGITCEWVEEVESTRG
jgi:hypothetical protein